MFCHWCHQWWGTGIQVARVMQNTSALIRSSNLLFNSSSSGTTLSRMQLRTTRFLPFTKNALPNRSFLAVDVFYIYAMMPMWMLMKTMISIFRAKFWKRRSCPILPLLATMNNSTQWLWRCYSTDCSKLHHICELQHWREKLLSKGRWYALMCVTLWWLPASA